jgi:hypothetical protein
LDFFAGIVKVQYHDTGLPRNKKGSGIRKPGRPDAGFGV